MKHEQRLATKNMSNIVHNFDFVVAMNVNYAPQLARNSTLNTGRGGFPSRGGFNARGNGYRGGRVRG